MARTKAPTQYDAFIAALRKDLGITIPIPIYYRAKIKANLAGTANIWKNTITLCKPYLSAHLIAHEYRHIWQGLNGILVVPPQGEFIWYGKPCKTENVVRGNVPATYSEQPWEKDANDYAKLAVSEDRFLHLLGDGTRVY